MSMVWIVMFDFFTLLGSFEYVDDETRLTYDIFNARRLSLRVGSVVLSLAHRCPFETASMTEDCSIVNVRTQEGASSSCLYGTKQEFEKSTTHVAGPRLRATPSPRETCALNGRIKTCRRSVIVPWRRTAKE